MSLTQYSRYRRLKLRAAWELAGMAVWCKEVGKYLLAFLIALALVQYITDTAIAEDNAKQTAQRQAQRADKLERTWLSCLRDKGVWLNGDLHICSVVDTHLKQVHFTNQ